MSEECPIFIEKLHSASARQKLEQIDSLTAVDQLDNAVADLYELLYYGEDGN